MIIITKASINNLPDIYPLFDLYRIFYGQKSDIEAAKNFLNLRMESNESIIFVAYLKNKPIGFTQLFKTFSSVSLESSLILNDLYVDKSSRKKGAGKALLNKAKEYCIDKKYKGLALETHIDNPAQTLYEKLGWKKDSQCFHYFWSPK
ncbi:GNAT superfamily N-acetyltransferase [Saonia flava]|uniref:GNAT superfamily N-acetyltransferase n=1 Tax=Saonia flava TaxID=523696 RepID=A0A846QWA0_9FLAO|nr:GNAT family N-acetyltransferase [Saonia flava]NJB70553.1 GNAT superfamily N-acetyltransferase [Saonia flava]